MHGYSGNECVSVSMCIQNQNLYTREMIGFNWTDRIGCYRGIRIQIMQNTKPNFGFISLKDNNNSTISSGH